VDETINPKVAALFPNIRSALDFLKSPLFHDFMALFAASQTPGKDDDKAAFKQLLIDGGMPDMADLVDPLYEIIVTLMNTLKSAAPEEQQSIRVGGFFGAKKSQFHPCIRIRAAREYAKENGVSIGSALVKVRTITDEQIDEFATQAGLNVGQIGDGKILQWIIDHGPQIMEIIRLILAALMAA